MAIPPGEALASRASQMLDVIAEGGLILSTDDVAEISTNTGKPVENRRDVVKATEAKAYKRDGQLLLTALIDPAYEGPLQEAADMGGRTLQEHCSEVMNWALSQGWLLEVPQPGAMRVFTKEQEAWLSKELGLENFSVAELIGHIKAIKRGKKAEVPELTTA